MQLAEESQSHLFIGGFETGFLVLQELPRYRGSSWRTKKPVQFGTRARPPFADRGGHSGGGNGAAGSNSGGSGGLWGNGHHGRRGSPSGRSPRDDSRRHFKRGGFSSRPTPRFHTNNVSVPQQGVECLFLRTQNRAPYRTPSACSNRAAYPDPPPVVRHPESIDTQTAYRGRHSTIAWLANTWKCRGY